MIIITRPKPAYGRQSLEGGIADHDTDQAVTFWGVLNISLRAYGAQASLVVMVFHGSRLVFHGSCSFCHDSRLVFMVCHGSRPIIHGSRLVSIQAEHRRHEVRR